MRQAPDGTFYFGEEFGPFIVHVDAKGRVLDAPVSADGKTLYPFLEGALIGDDPLVRHVYEFDLKDRRYTGRNWI